MSGTKPRFIALFPILFFMGATFFFGATLGDSKAVDSLVLFMVTALISIFMFPSIPTMDKVDIFAKEAANPNIIIMIMIFLLAGVFSTIAKVGGGVDSIVNLFLTVVPSSFLVAGLFLVSCFIGVSLGTSVGTVVALAPIAVGLAEKTGLPVGMVMGAALGGAAFGDNLSMISDTTIAATRLCGVSLTEKFKVNAILIIPVAILTMIYYSIQTGGAEFTFVAGEYDIFKVIPFFIVLITALSGVNVFYVLLLGIACSGFVGIITNSFPDTGHGQVISLLGVVYQGMMGMAKICLIIVLITGVIGMIKHNGGMLWLTNKLQSRVSTKRGGIISIGIATMVGTALVSAATVGIVSVGSIAMETAKKYNLDNRKVATILGIFATAVSANIPWGPPLLAATSAAEAALTSGTITAFEIIKYATYSHLVIVTTFIAIAVGFPRLKDEKYTDIDTVH